MEELSAVILAGGFGTRLRSVVSDRPKVLAQVLGKPYLSYLLKFLVKFGIEKVILCTGFMSSKVEDTYGENFKGLKIIYSKEDSPLGTAGALRLALPHIDSDPALVLNGDSYFDVNLLEFFNWHKIKQANASIVLNEVLDTERFGRCLLNEKAEVIGFTEKGISGPGLINAGIYLISKDKISEIPEKIAVSIEKEVFPSWVGQGFFGFKTTGKFIDIGTPESYNAAGEFFK